jgi:lipid A 3-O-deacylase
VIASPARGGPAAATRALALCAALASTALADAEDAPAGAPVATPAGADLSLRDHPPDPAALAQDHDGAGWGPLVRFSAIWENDGTFPGAFSGSDEHYTNGLKLDFAWRPAWADGLAPVIPFGDGLDGVETAFGLSVFQLMFTPEDLEEKDLIEDDRPYAGWLGVAAYWQRAGAFNDRTSVLDHIEFDLGVVGEASGAQALQTFIHSAFPDQIKPAGWGNQLSHEVAANLTLRRKYRVTSLPADSGLAFQVIPGFGGTLGTVYRRLEADVTVRLGWNLPNDFGATRIADVGSATGGWPGAWGLYVFLRGGGTLSEHNIFLDGNNFQNSHFVTKNPLVGEGQVGVVLQLFRGLEIGYSHTFLTEEFEDQDGTHSFGTFSIGYRAAF